ncbi:MAG: hypothetical protein JWR83_3094, partial [Aeromicrobium sp.]|nr:hypothetical protein [Aeromicrobium sp.]
MAGKRLTAVAVTLVIMGMTMTAVAAATPDPEPSKDNPAMKNVVTSGIPARAEVLEGLAGDVRSLGDPSFGAVAIDVDTNSLTLWWEGELSREAQSFVDEAKKSATIRLLPAKFSRAELDDAVAKIYDVDKSDDSFALQRVTIESVDHPPVEYGLS